MGRLDGKTILVIGGAQGIGRGCVLAAAAEGAHVVIGDLNERGAAEVAADATARGARAVGMAGDVVGRLIAMQAVYEELRAHGGSIVNFSSGAGVEGLAGRAAYSSAKAAVRLMSRTAALEWGAEGIRVNCVCPFAMSPSLADAVRAGTVDQAQLDAVSPLGRPGDPERDIGAGVAFLLSDDARYVTGQTFMLDGGGLAL